MGRSESRRMLRAKKVVHKPTFKFLALALTLVSGFCLIAASTRATGSAPDKGLTADRLPQVPDAAEGIQLQVRQGGAAPTVQAVQRYINRTYLTQHTTQAFDSAGGDLIVLYASSHDNVGFAPSDNYGNTWISIAGPTNTSRGFDLRSEIWYAPKPKVGPMHTITMGMSKKQPLVMSIFVVKGADANSPIQALSQIGSDGNTKSVLASSPAITTTSHNELLLGWAKVAAGASFQAGSRFMQQAQGSSDYLDAESGVAPSPADYRATFLINKRQTWESAVVAVAPRSDQATLTWSGASADPNTEYVVERCAGSSCNDFRQVGVTKDNRYIDSGLHPRTVYAYRVAKTGTNGKPIYSAAAALTTSSVEPSLPGNLIATTVSATKIRLTWSPPNGAGRDAKYTIERCLGVNCTDFANLATSATTSYTDTTLIPGATYNYEVRAVAADSTRGPAARVAQATVVPVRVGYLVPFAFAFVAPWYKRVWKFFA